MKHLRPPVLLCLLVVLSAAGARAADPAGDQLKLAIILSRHSVRSPLATNEQLGAYSAQAWPKWEVAPGIQTAHGNLIVAQIGEYYRARFAEAGLLTGDPALDGPGIFVRADNDQRTIETGRILARALVPTLEPEVHALPDGTKDPLFRPSEAHVGRLDREKAVAAVLGRLGGDARNIDRAFAAQYAQLKGILYGPAGAGNTPFDQSTEILPGEDGGTIRIKGPLGPALTCTDALLLEYTQGMPSQDVGWGRMDGKALTDLLVLHDMVFDLQKRTPYLAQAEGSNLVSHILDTLEQGALGAPVPGALGADGQKVVIIVGHDTNIESVGGLLGLNWWLPGTQIDPLLPGGALVFELWKHGGQDGAYFVRVSYVSQTLEQMREAGADTPAKPPVRAPIFVPESSDASPRFDAPLAAFVRHARKVIDPEFISPEP